MEGSSRGALKTGRDELEQLLGQVDPGALADELFAVARTLDGSAALRRALGDPAREVEDRQQLAQGLFAGKVSEQAVQIVRTLVGERWAAERDLADAFDLLGAEAGLAHAEREGRLDAVESELFQVGRLVEGDPDLRDALANRQRSGADKAALVRQLLADKVAPETIGLVTIAAENPRGQRFGQALERYSQVAARRREQLVALVTSAQPLTPEHAQRLTEALRRQYDKPIQLNAVVDPDVVGGVRIQIGDDVIDGTIARRLDDARRAMAG